MAVARHSDNIELQDEDTNSENETTVTARINMSEEGHYDRLDLQKIDNAVYEDLRPKTKKNKGRPKILQSDRRPLIVVAGFLAMLCLMLLGVIIGLVVHFNNNWTPEKNQTDCNNLILEQLKTNYSNMILERNNLQSEVNQLKKDKSCPSGWMKLGDSCYYRSIHLNTWEGSREKCLAMGANLVIINNQEEQVFINGLNGGGASWIGLKRTEGRWTWVDGTPPTTQYWASGYPFDDENWSCAFDYQNVGWYNGLCSTNPRRFWICEK